MKYIGSCFEYKKERNDELLRAYRKALSDCGRICLPELFVTVVNTPTSRFWVSEHRAAIVISEMFRGIRSVRTGTKAEMFDEIFRRVRILQEQHPEMSVFELTQTVVSRPAPKFYLTPDSAKVIVHNIIKSKRK